MNAFFFKIISAGISAFLAGNIFADPAVKMVFFPVEKPKTFLSQTKNAVAFFFEKTKKIPKKNIKNVLPSAPIKLNLWLFNAAADDFLWPINVFETKTKFVKISPRVFADKKSYFLALKNAIAAGKPPDIALLPDDFFDDFSENLAPAPKNFFAVRECRDFYFSFACAAFEKRQKMFGLPLFVRAPATIANRDLFRDDRVALGDRPAENWDDFLDNFSGFQKFQKKTIFALFSPENAAEFFAAIAVQSPQKLSKKNLAVALKNFRKFAAISKNKNAEKSAFLAGNVGIIFGDETRRKNLLREKNALRKNAVVVFPLPQIDPKNPRNLARTNGFVIFEKGKNPALAWGFLAFLADEKNLESIQNRSGRRVAWKFFGPENAEKKRLLRGFLPVGKTGGLEFSQIFRENIFAFFNRQISADNFAEKLFPFL